MKNILFVNNNIQNCGVYQYGKRVFDICSKSQTHNFSSIEISSFQELFNYLEKNKLDVIIYNYIPSTMPWLNDDILNVIKNQNIKQGNIIHNAEYGGFDFYLHQNPYYPSNENNFALPRPLFDYVPSKPVEKNNKVIKIGSFGFSGQHKFVHEICRAVNEEFVSQEVELNLHITKGYSSADIFEEIKDECSSVITNKNITVNFSNHFLSNQELLDFLFNNDLNIFFYENYSFYNGISSTIDYALSVKKPIAICKSNMFSHIMDVEPSICVEDTDLLEIINNGFNPLLEKYKSWSHENFIHTVDLIIDNLN